MNLTESQLIALNHVRQYSCSRKKSAQEKIAHILKMSNIESKDWRIAIDQLKNHARVALHFHPDRMTDKMDSVADSLLASGYYKNQFETFISNGLVSPHVGGDRDQWEQKLFGNAYSSHAQERPKYGALSLFPFPDGPSPRFGSCYFLLKPHVSKNCSFTYMDSHQNPDEKGTWDEFDDIVAALLSDIFIRNFALGKNDLTITAFINDLKHLNTSNQISAKPSRNLDHYIEAQVHSTISLNDDVDSLVIDSSFQQTDTASTLKKICEKYDIQLRWRSGFKLGVNFVPDNFRGPSMPTLAKRISKDDFVSAQLIGEAAVSLKKNPALWLDRGTEAEVLQELKLLWHVLVKFGSVDFQ